VHTPLPHPHLTNALASPLHHPRLHHQRPTTWARIPPVPHRVLARHHPQARAQARASAHQTVHQSADDVIHSPSARSQSALSSLRTLPPSAAPPQRTTCAIRTVPHERWRQGGRYAFAHRRRTARQCMLGYFTLPSWSFRYGGSVRSGVCRRLGSLGGLIRKKRCLWTIRRSSLVRLLLHRGFWTKAHSSSI
jgi:hypothetical protein